MGDLDSDGLNDFAITSNYTSLGEVTIVKFDVEGAVASYSTIAASSLGVSGLDSAGARFGTAVEGVADWDENGMADLLVGAPGLDGGSILLVSLRSSSSGFVQLDSQETTKQLASKTAIGESTAAGLGEGDDDAVAVRDSHVAKVRVVADDARDRRRLI